MRRVFGMILAFVLVLGMCSCQETDGSKDPQDQSGKGFYALVSEDNQGGRDVLYLHI